MELAHGGGIPLAKVQGTAARTGCRRPCYRLAHMTTTMNAQKALGYLIAGTINATLTEYDGEPAKCCPICCGPCSALKWYADNDRDAADAAIIAIMSGPTERYDWQNPVTLNIDWQSIFEAWDRPCDNAEWHDEA